jgi:hypothetical protein
VSFTPGKPFLPYEQLLAVQPPASCTLLPECYHYLMTSPNVRPQGGAWGGWAGPGRNAWAAAPSARTGSAQPENTAVRAYHPHALFPNPSSPSPPPPPPRKNPAPPPPQSPIRDFYPVKFDIDMEGKRAEWEGIVKIPFISEERLLAVARSIAPEQ